MEELKMVKMSHNLISAEAIAKLRNDEHYYGDFGKQYLSNSDINTLLTDPDLFRVFEEDNINFLKGRYLHYRVLEPHRVGEIPVVNCATRNNKEYKEYKEQTGGPALLAKEVEEMDRCYTRLKSNEALWHLLTGDVEDESEFEKPVVGTINGYLFKGKLDRDNQAAGLGIDLKTTRDLKSFENNFYRYGYHTQARIYEKLSLQEMVFVVVSKSDLRLGYYTLSEYSKERADQDIERGLELYEMYYSGNPSDDILQYYTFKQI